MSQPVGTPGGRPPGRTEGGGHRVLTCVLPQGVGATLRDRLFGELGLARVDVHSARGFIGADPAGLFNRVEKDVLNLVVEADRADAVFDWIYHEGAVAALEGRFLYMTDLESATGFALPDLPREAGRD